MKIGDLFVALGFEVDDTKLKSFQAGITKTLEGLLGISTAAYGAVEALKAVNNAMDFSVALRDFQTASGMSKETTERYINLLRGANPGMKNDEALAKLSALVASIEKNKITGEGGNVMGGIAIDTLSGMTTQQAIDRIMNGYENHKTFFGNQMVQSERLAGFGFGTEWENVANQKPEQRAHNWNMPIMTEDQSDYDVKAAQNIQDTKTAIGGLENEGSSHFLHFIGNIKKSLDNRVEQSDSDMDQFKEYQDEEDRTGKLPTDNKIDLKETTDYLKNFAARHTPDNQAEQAIAPKDYSGPMEPGKVENLLTQNNTFNIQTTAPADDVARDVAKENQRQYNQAVQQMNNGAQ